MQAVPLVSGRTRKNLHSLRIEGDHKGHLAQPSFMQNPFLCGSPDVPQLKAWINAALAGSAPGSSFCPWLPQRLLPLVQLPAPSWGHHSPYQGVISELHGYHNLPTEGSQVSVLSKGSLFLICPSPGEPQELPRLSALLVDVPLSFSYSSCMA